MTTVEIEGTKSKQFMLKEGLPQGSAISPLLFVISINGLYFGAHTEKRAVKCRKRNRVIKALAWKEWGNQLKTQRTLYIQWIRSCLEYASSSWSPWISNTNTLKLERIQREALRGMTGLAKICQSDFLHLEAGVEPLPARFEKMDEILYNKYLRLPPDDARFQLTQRSIPHV